MNNRIDRNLIWQFHAKNSDHPPLHYIGCGMITKEILPRGSLEARVHGSFEYNITPADILLKRLNIEIMTLCPECRGQVTEVLMFEKPLEVDSD